MQVHRHSGVGCAIGKNNPIETVVINWVPRSAPDGRGAPADYTEGLGADTEELSAPHGTRIGVGIAKPVSADGPARVYCLCAITVYVYNLHGKSARWGRISGRCSLWTASIKIHEDGRKKNKKEEQFPVRLMGRHF
jgi:hypothetical protein